MTQYEQLALFDMDPMTNDWDIHEEDDSLEDIPDQYTTTWILNRIPGLSYRQLDYWTRKGLVGDDATRQVGSGYNRLYSGKDVLTMRYIVRLLRSGFKLDPAHEIATVLVEHNPKNIALRSRTNDQPFILVKPQL